ncbi:hypothetical protein [Alteromonas ponticola]|uniref:DNA polymerase III subunit psi n=1 Tax=Alteromonas ponticola TaxID=2720613 RepID=A0ABX1QZB9_9ALTE|nr:hypothetical protein [Alteromonas ponticola]NMH59554.1 DNA polymerase III subunit psi [Alteromonas ponticola]
MSSNLSALQIATLQEMGITVWSKQSHAHEVTSVHETDKSNTSQPTSRANLTHLRSIVSAGKSEKPSSTPFPKDAEKHHFQWIHDVEQALTERLTNKPEISWFVGDTVQVSASSIVLPGLPSALSMQDKRQLWEQICSITRDH